MACGDKALARKEISNWRPPGNKQRNIRLTVTKKQLLAPNCFAFESYKDICAASGIFWMGKRFGVEATSTTSSRNSRGKVNDTNLNSPLNLPLQSKLAGGGTPLCQGWQEPLTLKEQTPPTPTVISRRRLYLSNYACTSESRHLRLVMCRSWISIRLPRLSDTSVFAATTRLSKDIFKGFSYVSVRLNGGLVFLSRFQNPWFHAWLCIVSSFRRLSRASTATPHSWYEFLAHHLTNYSLPSVTLKARDKVVHVLEKYLRGVRDPKKVGDEEAQSEPLHSINTRDAYTQIGELAVSLSHRTLMLELDGHPSNGAQSRWLPLQAVLKLAEFEFSPSSRLCQRKNHKTLTNTFPAGLYWTGLKEQDGPIDESAAVNVWMAVEESGINDMLTVFSTTSGNIGTCNTETEESNLEKPQNTTQHLPCRSILNDSEEHWNLGRRDRREGPQDQLNNTLLHFSVAGRGRGGSALFGVYIVSATLNLTN
ncbi:hypothetical protein J6590_061627 [Homalodisca vitripennis]|nr:hypothetical protein J6590_061627 [Homalodisca vitripennis]